MLRSLHMLALALATTLASASSATAITAETALRANSEFSQPRVTDFAAQAREAHQQIALGYGESASDSSLASRGAATTVRGGVTAATQAGRQVGRFRLTETVARHADDIVTRGPYKGQPARPYLNSPHTIEQIMQGGRGVPDQGNRI